jgi:integrase
MAKHDPNRLYAVGDGRWQKTIRGRTHKFGRRGGTFDEAMREFLRVKPDLFAGRRLRPQAKRPRAVTVKLVADSFLTALTKRVAGEGRPMDAGTFDDYRGALKSFSADVGRDRDPMDLEPDDFARVRRGWAKTMGPWALDRNVQAVRTMFRWADRHRLIPRQPFYGDSFGKSTEAEKRTRTRETERARGARAFDAVELGHILDAATGQLRAMILLALNGGMYAADLARIRTGDFKDEDGVTVLDFARGKTGGVPWKFVLWNETKAAVDEILASRPVARDPANADLLFLTARGNPWQSKTVHRSGAGIARVSETHGILQEFDKLLNSRCILVDPKAWKWRLLKRPGIGFGTFRHTHVSAVGDHADVAAAHRVSGHKPAGVRAKHYDKVPIHRLKSVTDLAHTRLLTHS